MATLNNVGIFITLLVSILFVEKATAVPLDELNSLMQNVQQDGVQPNVSANIVPSDVLGHGYNRFTGGFAGRCLASYARVPYGASGVVYHLDYAATTEDYDTDRRLTASAKFSWGIGVSGGDVAATYGSRRFVSLSASQRAIIARVSVSPKSLILSNANLQPGLPSDFEGFIDNCGDRYVARIQREASLVVVFVVSSNSRQALDTLDASFSGSASGAGYDFSTSAQLTNKISNSIKTLHVNVDATSIGYTGSLPIHNVDLMLEFIRDFPAIVAHCAPSASSSSVATCDSINRFDTRGDSGYFADVISDTAPYPGRGKLSTQYQQFSHLADSVSMLALAKAQVEEYDNGNYDYWPQLGLSGQISAIREDLDDFLTEAADVGEACREKPADCHAVGISDLVARIKRYLRDDNFPQQVRSKKVPFCQYNAPENRCISSGSSAGLIEKHIVDVPAGQFALVALEGTIASPKNGLGHTRPEDIRHIQIKLMRSGTVMHRLTGTPAHHDDTYRGPICVRGPMSVSLLVDGPIGGDAWGETRDWTGNQFAARYWNVSAVQAGTLADFPDKCSP
ncbi:MAG: hypothetical protein Q7V31_16885 [Parvibaculum sp.]|uniref:hypothetical protein n=1 Tax=Parvibaculum sp. TaxID=2024848 RepID=UPI00271FA4A9|nr:hypothetical protein [Parvibaculum sp.]MDO8840589.1 hypothetical protein [Parvibaculum sp.]